MVDRQGARKREVIDKLPIGGPECIGFVQALEGRKRDSRKKADDCDHHQELEQGKTGTRRDPLVPKCNSKPIQGRGMRPISDGLNVHASTPSSGCCPCSIQ